MWFLWTNGLSQISGVKEIVNAVGVWDHALHGLFFLFGYVRRFYDIFYKFSCACYNFLHSVGLLLTFVDYFGIIWLSYAFVWRGCCNDWY